MREPVPLPSDGPALALAEAARRRGRRYSREHVFGLMGRHPQAGSLLALVEVAPLLGLEPSAGQGDLETLDALEPGELPAVLHFSADGEQGFGLLEAVLPGGTGFRVWDSAHGSRVLARDTLPALWSGVVVFLEPAGHAPPEPGGWHRRAREWLLRDWRPRTGLVGRDGSPVVRWGLGALAAALLLLAVLAQPPGLGWRAGAVAGLTVLGLAAALTAAAWTRGSKATGLCGSGGALDCDSVLLSDWASVGGVPLSGLGTAFFGASLLTQGAGALTGSAAPLWLAGAGFLLALPVSVVLVAVQAVMRRFCTLCLAVHAVDGAGAALFLFGVWPVLPAPPAGLLPAALLWLLLFGVLLATAVPTLLRDDTPVETLRREHSRLLRSPLATLARLLDEPRQAVDGASVGALLGAGDAPHTLVVLVHPSCHFCGPVLEALEQALTRHPGLLRAYVAVAPRSDEPRDAALCEVLASAGAAWGGEVLVQLYRVVKADVPRWLGEADVAAALTAAAGLEVAVLARHEDVGHARVREASVLLSRAPGLPALFLDGRRCEAPLAHVEAWCSRPPLRALLQAGDNTQSEGTQSP
jgi:uncharacterized membrane protein